MSIDVSHDPTAFDRPSKSTTPRIPRELWRGMGRPKVYPLMTDAVVEMAYYDNTVPLRVYAELLEVPYSALKSAVRAAQLRGRRWCMPKTRKAA